MKAQTKMLVLFTCRVAHTFRTSSLSALRPERDALAAECRRRPARSGGALRSAPAVPDVAPVAGRDVAGVTLKIAFDAQRGVADLSRDTSERFICEESLDMVHRLRRASDAVLVGRATVDVDHCTLTVRRVALPRDQTQPARVILDPRRELDLDRHRVFRDGLATIVVHVLGADESERVDDVKRTRDATYVTSTPKGYPNVVLLGLKPIHHEGKERLSAKHICEVLAQEFDLRHVMVEGGANTALQFLEEAAVNRAILVHAPVRFEEPLRSDISPAVLDRAGLKHVGSYELGVDSVECFSRRGAPWPSEDVSVWP